MSGSCIELPPPGKTIGVVRLEKRRRFVDVLAREAAAGAEGHQLEPVRRLRGARRSHEQPDGLIDEAADRNARLRRALLQLRQQPLVKRNRRPHDARSYQHCITASTWDLESRLRCAAHTKDTTVTRAAG